jgi:hypothetical protein
VQKRQIRNTAYKTARAMGMGKSDSMKIALGTMKKAAGRPSRVKKKRRAC